MRSPYDESLPTPVMSAKDNLELATPRHAPRIIIPGRSVHALPLTSASTFHKRLAIPRHNIRMLTFLLICLLQLRPLSISPHQTRKQ